MNGDVPAAKQERIKEGKYNEAAAAKGIRFIPFAMETYGKLGTKALRLCGLSDRVTACRHVHTLMSRTRIRTTPR